MGCRLAFPGTCRPSLNASVDPVSGRVESANDNMKYRASLESKRNKGQTHSGKFNLSMTRAVNEARRLEPRKLVNASKAHSRHTAQSFSFSLSSIILANSEKKV